MEIHCESCGYIMTLETKHNIAHKPCCRCGSNNLTINFNLLDQLRIDYKEKIVGNLKKVNFKKPRVEFKHGDDYFQKGNKWNKLDRVIDRENNWYYEKIIDPDTGNILRYCEEKLSEHQGHGSAKKKQN